MNAGLLFKEMFILFCLECFKNMTREGKKQRLTKGIFFLHFPFLFFPHLLWVLRQDAVHENYFNSPQQCVLEAGLFSSGVDSVRTAAMQEDVGLIFWGKTTSPFYMTLDYICVHILTYICESSVNIRFSLILVTRVELFSFFCIVRIRDQINDIFCILNRLCLHVCLLICVTHKSSSRFRRNFKR